MTLLSGEVIKTASNVVQFTLREIRVASSLSLSKVRARVYSFAFDTWKLRHSQSFAILLFHCDDTSLIDMYPPFFQLILLQSSSPSFTSKNIRLKAFFTISCRILSITQNTPSVNPHTRGCKIFLVKSYYKRWVDVYLRNGNRNHDDKWTWGIAACPVKCGLLFNRRLEQRLCR
jgi:hypothetical protein